MSGVAYHAWTHRPKELGGTDPIAGTTPAWIAVTTQNQGYESDGTNDIVDWLEVFMSSNATGIFDYVTLTGAGQFGDDISYPVLLGSGIYTYTVYIDFDSQPDTSSFDFKFQMGIEPIDITSGDPWPGRQGSETFIKHNFYVPKTSNWSSDIHETMTITVPISQGSGNYPMRTGNVSLDWNNTSIGSLFVSVQQFITYHGPVGWDNEGFATPTWTAFP